MSYVLHTFKGDHARQYVSAVAIYDVCIILRSVEGCQASNGDLEDKNFKVWTLVDVTSGRNPSKLREDSIVFAETSIAPLHSLRGLACRIRPLASPSLIQHKTRRLLLPLSRPMWSGQPQQRSWSGGSNGLIN